MFFFPEKQLEKEITVLASNQAFLINNQTTALEVLPSLDFEPLNQFLHYADENQDPPVSVFGTSPPISIFCAEAFGDSCIYFIDEDRTKEGKVLLNRKILHPIEFNGDHIVFNPLADHARISISNRHPHLRFTSIKDIGTSCINAIIITIPVWGGDTYIRNVLSFLFPTLMADNNLPYLIQNRVSVTILVYTKKTDVVKLQQSKSFQILDKLTTIIFKLVDDEIANASNKYKLMGSFQNDAIKIFRSSSANALLFFTADMILSYNVLEYVLNKLHEAKKP